MTEFEKTLLSLKNEDTTLCVTDDVHFFLSLLTPEEKDKINRTRALDENANVTEYDESEMYESCGDNYTLCPREGLYFYTYEKDGKTEIEVTQDFDIIHYSYYRGGWDEPSGYEEDGIDEDGEGREYLSSEKEDGWTFVLNKDGTLNIYLFDKEEYDYCLVQSFDTIDLGKDRVEELGKLLKEREEESDYER